MTVRYNPSEAIDKATHDALMEHRTRPLTDDPIRRRHEMPQHANRQTLMDWLMAQAEAGSL